MHISADARKYLKEHIVGDNDPAYIFDWNPTNLAQLATNINALQGGPNPPTPTYIATPCTAMFVDLTTI